MRVKGGTWLSDGRGFGAGGEELWNLVHLSTDGSDARVEPSRPITRCSLTSYARHSTCLFQFVLVLFNQPHRGRPNDRDHIWDALRPVGA